MMLELNRNEIKWLPGLGGKGKANPTEAAQIRRTDKRFGEVLFYMSASQLDIVSGLRRHITPRPRQDETGKL